jgi:hypothetical protein
VLGWQLAGEWEFGLVHGLAAGMVLHLDLKKGLLLVQDLAHELAVRLGLEWALERGKELAPQ